jgi:DNA repair protein RadC
MQANASAHIAAHNPAEPSESDRLLTKDLLAAARPLGLKVLDRITVGEEATFSFADSGLLDELASEAGAW